MEQYKKYFPEEPVPSFLQWMLLAVPLSFVYVLILCGILYVLYCRRTINALYGSKSCFKKSKVEENRKFNFDVFSEKYNALGKITYEEVKKFKKYS